MKAYFGLNRNKIRFQIEKTKSGKALGTADLKLEKLEGSLAIVPVNRYLLIWNVDRESDGCDRLGHKRSSAAASRRRRHGRTLPATSASMLPVTTGHGRTSRSKSSSRRARWRARGKLRQHSGERWRVGLLGACGETTMATLW